MRTYNTSRSRCKQGGGANSLPSRQMCCLASKETHRKGEAVRDLKGLPNVQTEQLACDQRRLTLLAVLHQLQDDLPFELDRPQPRVLCLRSDGRRANHLSGGGGGGEQGYAQECASHGPHRYLILRGSGKAQGLAGSHCARPIPGDQAMLLQL